jgi:hypothetical protein
VKLAWARQPGLLSLNVEERLVVVQMGHAQRERRASRLDGPAPN